MIGLVMIAAGGALACVTPAQRIVARQRYLRAMDYGPALRVAIPTVPTDPDLDQLLASLD